MSYHYIGGFGGYRGSRSALHWSDFDFDGDVDGAIKRYKMALKMPSGCFISVPDSEEVKLLKKAYRNKKQVELRWHEIWVSDSEVLDLIFEFSFVTQVKASKFLGDLLMGVRNHSDIDVEMTEMVDNFGYVSGEFETLKETCDDKNLDPSDFKLKEVTNFYFVIGEDEV